MKSLFAAVTILALCLATSLAAAETAAQQCDPGQDCTEIDYTEADEVLGGILRPDGSVILRPGRSAGRSLVTVRGHFIPQMLKSVEDI